MRTNFPGRITGCLLHHRISGCLLAAVIFPGLTILSADPAHPKSETAALSQTANHGGERNGDIGDDENPGVFPPESRPYGSSYEDWTVKWWQWVLAIEAHNNPISDPNGADCAVHQSGPVWFLAGVGGPITSPITRYCDHVPADKAILFPIVNTENDYPCPEPPIFEPAPGQSLQDFLTNADRQFVDTIDHLKVDVDWVHLNDLFGYRATSKLFYFTGEPTLVAHLDPCITGKRQPAVSDGYWIMLKPLSPGQHTIHFSAGAGTVQFQDVTYHLTVVASHGGDR